MKKAAKINFLVAFFVFIYVFVGRSLGEPPALRAAVALFAPAPRCPHFVGSASARPLPSLSQAHHAAPACGYSYFRRIYFGSS
jgi:hypothetical protein